MTSRKRARAATRRLSQFATLGVLLGAGVFGTAAAVYATDGTGATTGVDPLPTVSALPSPTLSAPSLTDPTGLLPTGSTPSDSASPTPSASDSPTPTPTDSTGAASTSDNAALGSSGDVGTGGQVTSAATVAPKTGKTLSTHPLVKAPNQPVAAAVPTLPQQVPQSVTGQAATAAALVYPSGLSASTLHMLRLTSPLLSVGPLSQVAGVTAAPPLLAGTPTLATPVLTPVTPSADRRPAGSGVNDPVFDVGLLTLVAGAALAAGTRLRTWRRRQTVR